MKILLLLISISTMIFFSNDAVAGKCTGSSYCQACKNCSACKHCNGGGGTCGVCGGGDNYRKSRQKNNSYGNDKSGIATDQGNSPGSSYSSPSTSTYHSYSSYTEDSKSSPWIWIIIVLIVLYLAGKSNRK